ncbi:TonB-dependent receptor [Chitinophaga oryzae]|uniref:TonB-dependent receptor n=1 Tax=Chitinophaga oryzae TaxID=2725414 RepID=A0AAE6ZMI8_9BACT|nr:TonB-dependent receptor [Chitinophaga oryzae]QJB34540.1 TonB-dependent receptor [Chitinophaga oryzae]
MKKKLCPQPAIPRSLLRKTLLCMKLCLLLMTAFVLQLRAAVYSQTRFSINSKQMEMRRLLEWIETKSSYRFLYNFKTFPATDKVDVNFDNATLPAILDGVLQKSYTYRILEDNLVVISPAEKQQDITVKGKVVGNNGVELIGVSIQLKGTSRGTATDEHGNFSINTPANGVLIISYVGYASQEVPVNGKTQLSTITLKASDAGLNEVVVLGYGQKQIRQSVTGAISSIQTKELKQSPVANLTNALAGRLPGLITAQRSGRPGSDYSQLFIRGINTTGATNPLIVIDGLPRGNADLGQLDANEIESVTILKDASSTALYGIQGANGIVLVTTKRGQDGPPNIQINGQYALQQPTTFPRFLDSYRSGLLQNEAAKNDGMLPVWSDQQLEYFRTGLKPYDYPNTDWYNELIRNFSPQKTLNMNISGGSKYVRYFVSGSYLRQEPLYKHANENIYGIKYKYDRFNFRSNVDITLDKNTDLQVDLASRLENRTGPSSDRADFEFLWVVLSQMTNNLTPVKNPDGSIASGNMREDFYNPYGLLTRNGYLDAYWHSTNGSVALTRKLDFITPGLKVKGLFTFENYGTINVAFDQEFDSYRYKTVPGTGGGTYSQHRAATSLQRSGATSGERYYYYDVKLMYDRDFAKHSLGGLLLFNRNYRSQSGDLPRVYEGYVGRLTYNYDKKYYLEFNAGYNGSENFPPGRRYGFFPAVSAAWMVSNERFMPKDGALSYLKLRFSHGYVGNDLVGNGRWLYISDFAKTGGFTFGSVASGVGGYVENRIGNTAITWEKASKTDLGIETGFLKDKIKLNMDVFRELRSDILTQAGSIPAYLGITAALNRNLGRVVNRGVEVELNVNTNVRQVGVFVKANYQYVKNKILEMDEPKLAYAHQSQVGNPIGYGLGYIAEGLFQSKDEIAKSPKQTFAPLIPGDIKYKDIDNNGIINEADRVMLPMLNVPTGYFGVTLGVDYKGLDVSVLFQGATGGRQMYSAQLVYNYRESYRPIHEGRWTPETADKATFPALHLVESNMSNNFISSSYWIRKTDYIKLKNLEIGYRLPREWVKRVKLKSARIYVNGMNLVSWDNVKDLGVDPEANTADRWGWQPYPIMRIYNAGITINL